MRGPLLLLSLLACLVQGWVFGSGIEDIYKSASSLIVIPGVSDSGLVVCELKLRIYIKAPLLILLLLDR